MKAIKIFGTTTCHKTRFYMQWLMKNNVKHNFYDITNNPINAELLSQYYKDGSLHFPTLIVGNKRLRNPSIKDIEKAILKESILEIPIGYSQVIWNHKKYAVTKTSFNEGKSSKVLARNIANSEFISFNYYVTKSGPLLKPCEMDERKVIRFLQEYELQIDESALMQSE